MQHAFIGYYTLAVVFITLSSMYILDFSYWESKCMRAIRAALLFLCAVATLVGIFFSAADYPYAPLVVFMLLMPAYLLMWRFIIFKSNFRDYISWLPLPLFFCGFIVFVGWIVWCFQDVDHEVRVCGV